MARAEPGPAAEVVSQALLSPNLMSDHRLKLGERLKGLVRKRPTIKECQLVDATPVCPCIRLTVCEAPVPLPGLEQHKCVTWRVDGRDAEHLMLFLRERELLDGLASLLHAAEAARPGCRLHLLTYQQAAEATVRHLTAELVRQLAVELVAWRPDVAFHCAKDLDAAADHVYRVTRAVGEAAYKRTSARSSVSVELQSKDAQAKRVQLGRLLAKFKEPADGSKAALMRMALAVGAGADEAHAVGAKYGSLQGLLEAVERDGRDATRDAMARLPLPASASRQVGAAAAEKIVRVAALGA